MIEEHQEMGRGTPRDEEKNTKRWRTLMEDILEGHIEDTVVM